MTQVPYKTDNTKRRTALCRWQNRECALIPFEVFADPQMHALWRQKSKYYITRTGIQSVGLVSPNVAAEMFGFKLYERNKTLAPFAPYIVSLIASCQGNSVDVDLDAWQATELCVSTGTRQSFPLPSAGRWL